MIDESTIEHPAEHPAGEARTARASASPTAPATGRAAATPAGDDPGGDRAAPVAEVVGPALDAFLTGPPPLRIEFWDGSSIGPDDGPGTIRVVSGDALRRIARAPGELGFARAFVCGDIETEGPLAEMLRAMRGVIRDAKRVSPAAVPAALKAARSLGAFGRAPAPPPEEAAPRGVRHSIRRDRQAVTHHYDVGNRFYELVLGPSMTYSCARFATPQTSLEDAQAAKHDLIARKLGLGEAAFRAGCPGARPRLLDVGCGWGSMAIDAATTHDVDVVGITLSEEQARYARERVASAGLAGRIEIRVQDYRLLDDGPYDAISSIGMAEHVGHKRMATYFAGLHAQLRPGGRLLNHAISSVGGSRISRNSFIGRYVFPDGELLDLAETIARMEGAGFEVRDVEDLREHYARTLRHWVANLEARWDAAVEIVGVRRARVWRLYMSGSINGFDDGGLQIYQTLGVRTRADGTSAIPATRAGWV
jgi:cyclopropane-fatty-acyl-phospholipid synthase